MAQNTSADSASKNRVGRPSQTVSAIREMAKQQNERARENYAKAKEAAKQFVDPNKGRSTPTPAYSKKTIQGYLQNVGGNAPNLRKAMRFMFHRSQIMFRILNWYASIWDLRCRKVTPNYSLLKDVNDKKMLKSMNDTFDQLDTYKIHENMYAPLLRSYLDDVVFFIWFRDETGAFPYILNPDWCKIIGRYYTGDLMYAVDMSKYNSSQDLIEWLGSPLKEMYAEYKRTNNKYVKMPDEYAGCFKYRIDDLDTCLSPFVPLLPQLAALNDLEDIQAIADEQSIFKLLVYQIKTLSGSKIADDWQITPDVALDYFNRMVNSALPDYVSAVPILGDGLETVDFTQTTTDAQTDRVENAQNNVLNVSGGGAVLAANNITSTAAFNAWMKSESEFAISSLMPQITGFVNRMLSYDVSSPAKVDFFEVTVLTKDDFREKLLTSNQYGYPYRLALGTLYGFSEKETLASMYFENEVLKLQEKMIYPLQSSFTSSSGKTEDGYTNEVGQGRPSVDDGSLSPEGERSRNR